MTVSLNDAALDKKNPKLVKALLPVLQSPLSKKISFVNYWDQDMIAIGFESDAFLFYLLVENHDIPDGYIFLEIEEQNAEETAPPKIRFSANVPLSSLLSTLDGWI